MNFCFYSGLSMVSLALEQIHVHVHVIVMHVHVHVGSSWAFDMPQIDRPNVTTAVPMKHKMCTCMFELDCLAKVSSSVYTR